MATVTSDRRRRKRYSLLWRARLWVFLLLLLVALFVALQVNQARTAEHLRTAAVTGALDQAQTRFEFRQNRTMVLATWLASQDQFRELVSRKDSVAVRLFLAQLQPLDSGVVFTVWDAEKMQLAQHGPNSELVAGQGESVPVIAGAFAGQDVAELDSASTNRVRATIATPLHALNSNQIIGVLALSYSVADEILGAIEQVTPNQQIILIAGPRIVYSVPDSTLVGNVPPDPILATIKAGSSPAALGNSPTQYQYSFRKLGLPLASPDIFLGIGTSNTFADEIVSGLTNPLTMAIFLLLGVGSAIGLVYVNQLDSAVQELRAAMTRMAKSDYQTKIVTARRDEIGDLSGELERVRVRFLSELACAYNQVDSYARVINSMGIAAIQTDPSYCVVALNPAAETLLELSLEKIKGKPFPSIFMTEQEGTAAFGEAWQGGSSSPAPNGRRPAYHISKRLALRNNPALRVTVLSGQILDHGTPLGHVHVLLDGAQQDNAVRSRDEFMMHAAHELRSPVARLKVALDLLTESINEGDIEQQRSFLGNMQRALSQFQFFLENIILVGTTQQGRFQVFAVKTEIRSLLDAAVEQFQPLDYHQAKNVELRIELPLPCFVMADRVRITQVLFNLLSNAAKYGNPEKPVLVHGFLREHFAVIEVTDFGKGIDPGEESQIFDRYYRGRQVETEGMGIGIGLAIARDIVEQHGGAIGVRSTQSEGATFWISLPLA